MLEINNTKEVPEVIFLINLKNRSTNINGNTPAYWLNIKRVHTKTFPLVEEVIYIVTL